MNRYFISDKESDTLITLATKLYGLKIGELINIALKNEFLPVTEPFRTEAAFILQCNAKGTLDAWEIKQSMSRGIRALGTRPVYDSERLQGIFARYHLHEKRDNCSIANDEVLWESAVEVYAALGKPVSSDCSKLDGARLVDDIFADWDTLWFEKAVYDVLATLAYRCEPDVPFNWFEGITFLSGIERDALGQWSRIPKCKK